MQERHLQQKNVDEKHQKVQWEEIGPVHQIARPWNAPVPCPDLASN
jgi:hypothetical protein